jgi:hypothetical protein
MGLNDRKGGKVFVNYALSLFGATRDPRACRGIERKYNPASGILDLGWLPWGSAAVGEVFLGKQRFGVFPRV